MMNQELCPAILWMVLKKNEFSKSSLRFLEGASDRTNTTDLRQTVQAMGTTSRLCLNECP